MAYQVDPRIMEGAMIDRMTDGSRGLSAYDQRDLARRGLMPSKQQMINGRLAETRYNQGVIRNQQLQNKALEQQNKQASQPSYQQIVNQNRAKLAQTTQAPQAGGAQTPQTGYRYDIDYQAARDAGDFLRALKGQTGTANNRKTGKPNLKLATELLNKTPYSSINNAQGIAVDTDDQGNQVVSFMGPENAVLGKIPMQQLEQQLSNLNNYASRVGMRATPGREAMFDSEELAAGAEAARASAMDQNNLATMGYQLDEQNQWTRPGKSGGFETYDPVKAGGQAYDDYLNQYGARPGSVQPVVDSGFYRTQTPAGEGDYNLGFNTKSRYQQATQPGREKLDPAALARQLAGGGNGGSGEDDLPAPDDNNPAAAQREPTNNPTGGRRYMPAPYTYGNHQQVAQQNRYQPDPTGSAPQFNQQETAFINMIQPYLDQGSVIPWSQLQQMAQQQGLPNDSFQKIFQNLRG